MAAFGDMAFATFSIMSSVYRIREAGLDPLQLILVGTVLEASVFVFEVPTGVVADVYSRRLSLIIGFALIGAGFILEGVLPVFATILVAQAVWGIGYTFTSGARQAWLADELPNGDGVGGIFMRGSQLGQVGALAGIGLGVGLATISLALPLIAGGAMFVALAAFLIVVMPERGFRQSQVEDRGSFSEMWTTFTSGVRVVRMRHVLLAIIAAELFIGISSEPYDRLWALHMLDTFEFPSLFGLDPVTWFGVMSAGALLIGIGATGLIRKIFDLDEPRTPRRLLLATNAAMIAATLAFALSGSFGVAAAMVIAISVLRRISDPITDAWLNKHVDSSHRATVFSLHGQTNAFGQAALGPAMGVIATLTTLRAALVGVAVLLVPPQVIYAFVRGSGTTNHNENRKESHETD